MSLCVDDICCTWMCVCRATKRLPGRTDYVDLRLLGCLLGCYNIMSVGVKVKVSRQQHERRINTKRKTPQHHNRNTSRGHRSSTGGVTTSLASPGTTSAMMGSKGITSPSATNHVELAVGRNIMACVCGGGNRLTVFCVAYLYNHVLYSHMSFKLLFNTIQVVCISTSTTTTTTP